MRWPEAVALLALLLVPPCDAGVAVSATCLPRLVVGIPDTLEAGTRGTTALGANATSAVTSIAVTKSGSSLTTALGVRSRSASAQTTFLRLRSASGLANLTSITLTMGGVTQFTAASGLVSQSSGVPVPLAAGATVTVAGTAATLSSTMTAQLVFDLVEAPSALSGITSTMTWTLELS